MADTLPEDGVQLELFVQPPTPKPLPVQDFLGHQAYAFAYEELRRRHADEFLAIAQQHHGELTAPTRLTAERSVDAGQFDRIVRVAAELTRVRPDAMLEPGRGRELVRARQLAMWALREHTELSYPRIGALFGGRDHTTVLSAVQRFQGRLVAGDAKATQLAHLLSVSLHSAEVAA